MILLKKISKLLSVFAVVLLYLPVFAQSSDTVSKTHSESSDRKIVEGEDLQKGISFVLKDERSGAVVDYAHIYFPEKGEGTTSNDMGLFVIKDPSQYAGSEMIISRVGYLPKTIPFPSNRQDTVTIYLASDVQLLDELVVSGQTLTPLAIMQKVRDKLIKMDYLPQLNHYHVISTINDSKDSVQNETIVQLIGPQNGLDRDGGIGRIDVLTRKKLKRALYNKFKSYLSFPFIGATWTYPTVVEFFQHDAEKMAKYFSLRKEQDSTNRFTKIHFKAMNTSRKVTGMTKVSVYEGTIWVDEDSYLPVKINFFINSGWGGEFYFSTDFEVKNNTLVTVFSQHKHVFLPEEESNRQVVLQETCTWLKQEFIKHGELIPHTSHDMTLIKPDQKIWDQFNEFIQ